MHLNDPALHLNPRLDGDFLALLPPRALAHLESRADHLSVEATTVFAFHYRDGVLFAGDHRATAGNQIFSDRTEKIIDLDAVSMMAIAGSPSVAFEMARTLQTAFEYYRRSQLQPMSLPAKVRALSRLLANNLPATLQGVGAVAPIFAGLNVVTAENRREKPQPVIYFYDPLGANFEAATFAGSGSGSSHIKSILSYLENWGSPKPAELPLKDAVNLANRLLMTAAVFDSATGGVRPDDNAFGTIRTLSADGIQTIDAAQQASFWKEA